MTLVLLQRLAELLCTVGKLFSRPHLLETGIDLYNFVQGQKTRITYRVGAAAMPDVPTVGAIDSGTDGPIRGIRYAGPFKEIVDRAVLIDPAIGDIQDITAFELAPNGDRRLDCYLALKAMLPAGPIDSVVCVPWLRTGGADLVACLVAAALQGGEDGGRVVILRLDHSNLEREDWIPAGVEALDLSPILKKVDEKEAEDVLYALFMGINPKRILNVNSRLGWKTYMRYGSRLADHINLYAYLFCWDQTRNGVPVGYPTEVFAKTAPSLKLLFTDTQFLRSELIRIYRPPQSIRDRMIVLNSPARSAATPSTSIEAGIRSRGTRARPAILWAGRLDRQKRFDLAVDVARGAPNMDFLCWGEALVDAPPDRTQLPENIKLHGNFKGYDELPLEASDCWLFTSDWEGMPTLLIELAMRGVSIVASAVGGVPELIDATTGWPVPAGSTADAYIAALRDALSKPDVQIERARALQARVTDKHDPSRFAKHLWGLLSEAEGAGGASVSTSRARDPARADA